MSDQMYQFCTYFDRNYLTRGLALHDSLKRHSGSFRLWVLCLDNECFQILTRMSLPDLRLIRLEDFEKEDPDLLKAKQTRSKVEYYFTCTPSLPLYILNRHAEIEMITYLDADLYFFSDPQPIYDEIGCHSIAIIEHRFAERLRSKEVFGRFNVGWITFRRDATGLACLRDWRNCCNDWCYDRLQDGRFGDQKYLNEWPEKFGNLIILQQKGINVATWNFENYDFKLVDNRILVDEGSLIFYHFQGLKRLLGRVYETGVDGRWRILREIIKKNIYLPYIRELEANRIKLAEEFDHNWNFTNQRKTIRGSRLKKLGRELLRLKQIATVLISGNVVYYEEHSK